MTHACARGPERARAPGLPNAVVPLTSRVAGVYDESAMSRPAEHLGERFTYADVLSWPEDERWEVIEGVPRAMSPAPSTAHQRFVGEIYRQIANFLVDRSYQVFMAPFDVRLAAPATPPDEVATVVQPDVVVLCDLAGLDERGYQGTPEWIIEVLSASTSARDQITKLALYEAHGVRCY